MKFRRDIHVLIKSFWSFQVLKAYNTAVANCDKLKLKYLSQFVTAIHYAPFLKFSTLLWVLLLSPFFLSSSFAQSITELEAKRQRIQADIDLTSKLLDQKTSDKEAALERYETLQKQINRRQDLVGTLETEIAVANRRITRTADVIEALENDIEVLKSEYASIIQSAFRQKMTQSPLLFLLSAKDFNDAYKKWQYLRQYDDYRKRQANLIVETQKRLGQKKEALVNRKLQKEQLISEQKSQLSILNTEKSSRNRLYKELRKDEKRLKKDLNTYIASRNRLDQAIVDMVFAAANASSQKSVAASVPESVKEEKNAATSSVETEITASQLAIWTNDFQSQKGSLPWPVGSGIIIRSFGQQAHPTIPNITIQNNGIDIKTQSQESAKAIFEGVIAGIQFIPGYQNTIIVKHGEYFSVYSNLEGVTVEKGDRVKAGQILGSVSTNRIKKNTEIHFEIWRKKKRLNPVDWVRK